MDRLQQYQLARKTPSPNNKETNKNKKVTNKNKAKRGVMVKSLDCGIIVREFVVQSRYYVHFRTNTIWKGMNPLILPAMG